MGCLTAIGNGVVRKIAEYTVEPVGRQVGYIIYYNRNLKKLQNQVRDLDAEKESVEHKIVEEKRNGREVETLVTNWLTDVNKITGEAKDFLKDEHQAKIKCLYGFCPNLKARHHLSRKSTKLVQDVAELYGKKDFANIAYDIPPEEICVLSTKDYEACDSRTSILKNVMDELRSSNTDVIGVYGIGGVGKTTLVKQIYKQATKGERLFDEVVMVLDLKQDPSIERIQKEIAEKLGLMLPENATPAGRARHICSRIKEKKTLVLLDDIWENIDLEVLGLPRMATLKILLTSRSKIVLSRDMGTQKEFPLEVLDKNETWSLFQKMTGDIVKKPDIETVATQVAEKCGGLPLLIVTVARALKNSPLHAWKDALRQLKRLDGQGLANKAYAAIEWSYSKLDNEQLKSLLLLCANVVWTSNTSLIDDLWKYSLGLGLLKNVDTIGEAWDALNSLLDQLKDSCLLLENDDNTRFRMHDLVKEVAKRIAVEKQHVLSLSDGSELKEWPDKEFSEKCTMICLRKCNIPKLPQVWECQELTMFFLHNTDHDSFQEIPGNFFKEMKRLRVLDLTNRRMPSLPSSLQFLKDLRTLCLDQCTLGDIALVGQLQNLEILSFLESKFKQLPKEIGQLIHLRLLDLTGCSQLEVIIPNVLSSLKRLENLRMGNSFNRWEVGRAISTERSNANLEEMKNLHQLTALQIHIPDANMLPADLFTTKLERFQICIGPAWKWGDVDEALNTLKLQLTIRNELDQGLKLLLNRTEDLYLEGTEGANNSIVYQLGLESFLKLKHLHVQNNAEFANVINGKVGFPNLTWLAVSELNGLRFLLSSSMARSLTQLKRLQISGCQIMEAIVSTEESHEEIVETMFCQLQDLELKDLPNLTQFCSSRSYTKMPNPSFERLQLQSSSKHDKFTFDRLNKSSAICEIEESDSKGNFDIVIQPILFDKKVEFPNLKKLFIDGLAKLTTIWNNQFSIESSKNLELVEIVSCESLKSIFPVWVARSLQQLRRLTVKNCGVEEIVSNKIGLQTTPVFVFSKLTRLIFENLPQLRSFYPGLHDSNWPSLNALWVFGCDKVQIFAEGKRELYDQCTPKKQSLFLVEKDSFPDLEYLGLDATEQWDSQPLHLFRKLKSLCTYVHSNSSIDSLEKLLGLEKLNASGNGEIHAVGNGTFPHLRDLYLYGMRKLIHLGEDNSRPRELYPNFPNLEILELRECDSLKNLKSFAISFKTLTTLQFSFCKSLKYLVTYSMAKSLMQLTKLEVEDCEELIEIVESNESDDSVNEIEFKCLKHLKLSALPRLRWFCLGTRMVTFPSLETLSMNCTLLETFIFDPMGKSSTIRKENEENDSKENFLFDNKVGFPTLKNLCIKGISKLTTIWHNQLAPDSFCKLTEVEVNGCGSLLNIFVPSIGARLNSLHTLSVKECESVQEVFEVGGIDVTELHDTPTTPLTPFECQTLELVEIVSCESLKSIFPALVAGSLQQLRSLTVKNCGVEEIFSNKDGLQMTPISVFSKLTHVRFENLPQLRCVYPGLHASNWPSLNVLAVYGCDKVQIFAESLCTPNKQSLILVEKDSFPNLEELSLEVTENWDSQSLDLFRKLKSLRSYVHSNSSVDSLEKLLGLEKLNVGSNGEIHAFGNGTLPHLRELCLHGMRKLMHLGEDNSGPTCPNFPNLEILELKECDSLKNLRSSTISFKTLTTLQVSFCKSLKYLVTYSTAKSLMQLAKLEVEDCEEMIEIVESNDSGNEIEFKRLKHLKLSVLPRLRWFCSGTRMVTFPSLETLSMNCTLLETFIFDPMGKSSTIRKEIEESDSKENLQNVVPQFLFDNKVGFPSLKNLSIKGLSKLTTIWDDQLAPNSYCKLTEVEVHGCGNLLNIFVPSIGGRLNALHTLSVKECESVQVVFEVGEIDVTELHDTPATHLTAFDCQNLESIEIDSCESLKYIFPASMARGLQQLRQLIVKNCGVEEIIANEEGQQTTPKFVFSKVTFALFDCLPKLRNFYPGMHASSWPSLNYMGVFECDKVQIFAEEVSRFQEQREANNLCNSIKPSLFLIEKDSFPNLEKLVLNGLEIWNGPLPVQFFSKLKFLDVASPMSKSVVILVSLVPDVEGNNETSAVGMGAQLPHLRELRLVGMYKLMHLGEEEDNSQSARPNFPNLEILRLNGCFSLRNLRSSAIPFHNLTYLRVSVCYGLKCLITYSMAKSLIHLTKLEVGDCLRLVEIVGNNEDEDDSGNYEITFRRLKHLKLFRLPRLRGFCLRGNCSVKFPSLETLSISNRLKLMISQTIGVETLQTTDEKEDTDVDECEAAMQSMEDEINSASTNLIS